MKNSLLADADSMTDGSCRAIWLAKRGDMANHGQGMVLPTSEVDESIAGDLAKPSRTAPFMGLSRTEHNREVMQGALTAP